MADRSPHPWIEILEPSLYAQSFPARIVDGELSAFLVSLDAFIRAQRRPFAWVVQADATVSSSAGQRRMFAEAELRLQEYDRVLCVGTSFVLSSPVMRGVVTAVYWLAPPVYPYRFFATMPEARRWAQEQLAAR
jgi:hypothetical protein